MTPEYLRTLVAGAVKGFSSRDEQKAAEAFINGSLIKMYSDSRGRSFNKNFDLFHTLLDYFNRIPEKDFFQKASKIKAVLDTLFGLSGFVLPKKLDRASELISAWLSDAGDVENKWPREERDISELCEKLRFLCENVGRLITRSEFEKNFMGSDSTSTFGNLENAFQNIDAVIDERDFAETIIPDRFVIPEQVVRGAFENLQKYVVFSSLFRDGLLFSRQELSELSEKYIVAEPIISSVAGGDAEKFLAAAKELLKLRKLGLLFLRSEYVEIEKKYIIPEEIRAGLPSAETSKYGEAVKKLKELHSAGNLISLDDARDYVNVDPSYAEKIRSSARSLENYLKMQKIVKNKVRPVYFPVLEKIILNLSGLQTEAGEKLTSYACALKSCEVAWKSVDEKIINAVNATQRIDRTYIGIMAVLSFFFAGMTGIDTVHIMGAGKMSEFLGAVMAIILTPALGIFLERVFIKKTRNDDEFRDLILFLVVIGIMGGVCGAITFSPQKCLLFGIAAGVISYFAFATEKYSSVFTKCFGRINEVLDEYQKMDAGGRKKDSQV